MTTSATHEVGLFALALVAGLPGPASAQAPLPAATDANTPLHLLRPDYPVPYGPPTPERSPRCSSASADTSRHRRRRGSWTARPASPSATPRRTGSRSTTAARSFTGEKTLMETCQG